MNEWIILNKSKIVIKLKYLNGMRARLWSFPGFSLTPIFYTWRSLVLNTYWILKRHCHWTKDKLNHSS